MKKFGVVDLHGREVLPLVYEHLYEPSCGLFCCRKDKGDRDGFINSKGESVIPPKFQQALPFDRKTGLACVWETREGTDYYGLINTLGQYIMKPEYAGIYDCREGLIPFGSYAHHELIGFADLQGKVVLSPRYKRATSFSSGLAMVTYPEDLGRSFFIDRAGRRVLGPYGVTADREYAFGEDGIAFVHNLQSKTLCYIDVTGRVLLSPPSDVGIGQFSCGLGPAYDFRRKKHGFIDISGEWAIKPRYDGVLGYHEGYSCVEIGGNWGLIDTQGREVVPLKYKSSGQVGTPSCQRILYGESGKTPDSPLRYGYLSTATGKVMIPAKYSCGTSFVEGLAVVRSE